MRRHSLERILGRTFAWTGGFSRIGQKRRQKSIEALLGREYYWAGVLSRVRGQEYALPRFITPHFSYMPDFSQEEFIGVSPLTEQRISEYQQPIEEARQQPIKVQEVLANLEQTAQIPDPVQRQAETNRLIEQMHGFDFLKLSYTANLGEAYNQLQKLKDTAFQYAVQGWPGAVNSYFGISKEITKMEESHPFFPLARSMPKGVYKGPLDVGFVARDYSKSYVPQATELKADVIRTLDEAVRLCDEGIQSLQARDFARAAASYEQLLSVDNYSEAHYLAGACYRRTGNYKEAKRHLELALDYDLSGNVAEDARYELKAVKRDRWFGWIGRAAGRIANAFNHSEGSATGRAALRQGYAIS